MLFCDEECSWICWHPNGELLASGGLDKTVKLFDVRVGKPIEIFPSKEFRKIFTLIRTNRT